LWTACLAVILAAGCQYAGAGAPFQESYDFSAAASKDWVVTITNHRAHAQHTANPTYYGTATVTDDGAQQYLDLDVAPLCGTRPFDGMVVVHSESTARLIKYLTARAGATTTNAARDEATKEFICRQHD
jgi:hypothetical protein